jgi:hypothetical protein
MKRPLWTKKGPDTSVTLTTVPNTGGLREHDNMTRGGSEYERFKVLNLGKNVQIGNMDSTGSNFSYAKIPETPLYGRQKL